MGLNIRKLTTKKLARTFDGFLFYYIHLSSTAVVPASWVTFYAFVAKYRTLRLKDGATHDVLGRDEFDNVSLAIKFGANGTCDHRIGIRQPRGEIAGMSDVFLTAV